MLERIYPKLRIIGRRLISGDPARRSLDATDVVHTAIVRACRAASLRWSSEVHLVNIVARTMRQVLTDEARSRTRARCRPFAVVATVPRLQIDVPGPRGACRLDVLALDEALHRLERTDSERAAIAEARIFGGASFAEIAAERGVTAGAVEKRFAATRAWLVRQVEGISSR